MSHSNKPINGTDELASKLVRYMETAQLLVPKITKQEREHLIRKISAYMVTAVNIDRNETD